MAVLLESSRESGRALLRGIAEYIQVHGRWSVYWEPSGLTDVLPRISDRMDGLIVRDVGLGDSVLKLRIPTVVVGHLANEFSGCINVVTATEDIAKVGADHLLSRGYPSYAFCGLARYPSEPVPWSEVRRRSFSGLVEAAGYLCQSYTLPLLNAPDWGQQREALTQWIRTLPRPVGCMAANDDVATEVAAACKRLGLNVPDDVGILGADNDHLACGLSDPPLSSIGIGFERAGYQAAEALDRAMRLGERTSPRIVAEALHVVARRSTDSTAIGDPNLAKALRFIRDRAPEAEIAVPEVALAAGLSRRALERRFRDVMGGSIREHIRTLRINRIAQMLVETNLPISRVAEAMGFQEVQHFARYFRAGKGTTPLAFRNAARA